MDAASLLAFQQAIVADPKYFPIYDSSGNLLTTFCNLNVRATAQFCGYHGFDNANMDAEDEIRSILQSGDFKKVSGQNAAEAAANGILVIGEMSAEILHEAHAHVVTVVGLPMVMSGSLGKMVPKVANVGKGNPTSDLVSIPGDLNGHQTKPNWICASSMAFPIIDGECDYWQLNV